MTRGADAMSREPQWDEDDELYQCPDEDEICADCGRVGPDLLVRSPRGRWVPLEVPYRTRRRRC